MEVEKEKDEKEEEEEKIHEEKGEVIAWAVFSF